MTTTVDSARNTLIELPLTRVAPSPLNPRKHFAEDALAELAESIREHGLLQPITVRPVEGDNPLTGNQRYWIVAGERRYRAAQLAGLETIPAIVREDLDDVAHLKLAIVENLQRQDLDPIEEAEGYRQLQQVAGMRVTAIAAAVNRSQPAISNQMRLLELPEDVQELLRTKQLSASHGVALCRFKEFPAIVQELARLAVEQGLAAKALEATLPRSNDLSRAGLVEVLTNWTTEKLPFEACEACPFNARRKESMSYGTTQWCLKPAHFAELQAAEEAARQAQLDQAVATLKAGGTEALQLADLPYGTYEQIGSWGGTPTGCTEACPCRALGCDGAGRAVAICTDPKRYAKLKSADKRAETKAKKESVQGQLDASLARLDGLKEISSRELVLLVAELIGRPSKANHTAAAKRLGDAGGTLPTTRWEFGSLHMDLLAQQEPVALIRFLIEGLIREDLAQVVQGYRGGADRVTWWLGDTPAAAEPELAAADD